MFWESTGLAGKQKIVWFGEVNEATAKQLERLRDAFEVMFVHDASSAATLILRDGAVAVGGSAASDESSKTLLPVRTGRISRELPDGVVLLDSELVIRWSNDRFLQLTGRKEVIGQKFYATLGNAEVLGPDYCPFHTSLATVTRSTSKVRVGEKSHYELHVAPVTIEDAGDRFLIVLVRDITSEVLQQQKLQAIHEAGEKLNDLTPEEIFEMPMEDRIGLLKQNILHFTKSVLNYNVVEVRLLEEHSGELTSLLYEGMDLAAADRKLRAGIVGNGITGSVAATGESYLCEDTEDDELYVEGFKGARSSMTVPLMLHNKVIGTFNVESPEPRAFNENDLMFLELFARNVALALNTFELMAAESARNAEQNIEAIHGAVALPIDTILRETVFVLEAYMGHDRQVEERLKLILRNARFIRELIQQVGQQLVPIEALVSQSRVEQRQKFLNRRILVVDTDEKILADAHAILERFGAIVERARSGSEAIALVRTAGPGDNYDIIISDVRLEDEMTGHRLMVQLKPLMNRVPMILMQGFGYDPGHSIVKARQEGLHPKAVLYKPFRVDQLVDVIATVLEHHKVLDQPTPDASA